METKVTLSRSAKTHLVVDEFLRHIYSEGLADLSSLMPLSWSSNPSIIKSGLG